MSPLTSYSLYAGIGFFEWFLALSRTLSTIRNCKSIVALTVFIETLLGLLVFKRFIEQDDWVIAVVYSVGGAFGSLLPMWIMERRDGKSRDSGVCEGGVAGGDGGREDKDPGAIAVPGPESVL